VVDGKASPWLSVWQGRVRAVTTLARRLRLNPAGAHTPRADEARHEPRMISVYETMEMERASRDESN
jgi:hypothetical protein